MLNYIFLNIIISIILTRILALIPINLGLWVLLTTLILSVYFALFSSSWTAFLIFLIYVRGILVIFVYFIATLPSQQINLVPLFCITAMTTTVLILFSPWRNTMSEIPIFNFNSKIFIPFYQDTGLLLLIILGVVLFLALVLVVKLTKTSNGPLRPFIYVLFITKNTPIS